MFPEAQAHGTTCTRWLTKGGATIPDVVSYLAKSVGTGRTEKAGWQNTVHGRGDQSAFFFF